MSLMIGSYISCWKQQAQIQSHSKKRFLIASTQRAYRLWVISLLLHVRQDEPRSAIFFRRDGQADKTLNDCVHCAFPLNTCIDWLQWVAAVQGSLFCFLWDRVSHVWQLCFMLKAPSTDSKPKWKSPSNRMYSKSLPPLRYLIACL